jgi:thiol-disulfide isomerase/thioredoxin
VSDIPSHLSKWEPSRGIKVGFVVVAVLSLVVLYGSKIFKATVVDVRDLEAAMGAQRMSGAAALFELKDRDGRPLSLESLKGKVVFVNFWATWCAPCREEMPALGQLARSFDPADTVFLAISVDDGWEPIDGFLGRAPLPYRVLLDAGQATAEKYGTVQFPESYVIGRDGRLVYKFVGARDWGSMAAARILEKAGARKLARPVDPRS